MRRGGVRASVQPSVADEMQNSWLVLHQHVVKAAELEAKVDSGRLRDQACESSKTKGQLQSGMAGWLGGTWRFCREKASSAAAGVVRLCTLQGSTPFAGLPPCLSLKLVCASCARSRAAGGLTNARERVELCIRHQRVDSVQSFRPSAPRRARRAGAAGWLAGEEGNGIVWAKGLAAGTHQPGHEQVQAGES